MQKIYVLIIALFASTISLANGIDSLKKSDYSYSIVNSDSFSPSSSDKIVSLSIFDNGICEGDCPWINIKVDFLKKKGTYEISYREPPFKAYKGHLTQQTIRQADNVIRRLNFPIPVHEDSVHFTDQTTTIWDFHFSNGKSIIFQDYGQSSNATLTALYHVILDSIEHENK